ncbi:MAG TPA: amidohydrolase family protein [bacterium]|nr:amidohydrolase family protein [bacterium]
MKAFDLVLRNASLPGEPAGRDVAITGGRIAAVAPRIEGHGEREWPLDRRFVLPALVDPHLHLDKALSLPATGAADGWDRSVAMAAALRRRVSREDLLQRGARILDRAISRGVGALRTHANVDEDIGLLGVETALELRDRYSDRIDVQVVATVSHGLLPRHRGWALLEEAARLGCQAVGGSVGSGDDPAVVVEALCALAERANLSLDLHVDEHTDPRCPGLECLIRSTLAHAFQDRVVAAHCSALSSVSPEDRDRLITAVAEAGITIAALPLSNLYLQGRDSRPPGARGIAPVRELLGAGVRVVCGSDNVGDAFLPYGNADPLLAAVVLGVGGQLTSDAERDALRLMVTTEAAAALGLVGYGLLPGARADLVVMDCRPPEDPITSLPYRWRIVHGGRVHGEV